MKFHDIYSKVKHKTNVLICVDRDGTLIYDNKYHLGHQKNWKSKIRILPSVIQGLKLLKKIKNSSIYVLSNQPGLAIKDFKLLTIEREHEVCKEVLRRIKNKGADINGYFFCPYASPEFVKKHKEFNFDKKFVKDCYCMKPHPGMIFSALEKEGLTEGDTCIYFIGDRFSDVKTGINAGGIGIFVPFKKEKQEIKKVEKSKIKKIYKAKNFLDAAKFIYQLEN